MSWEDHYRRREVMDSVLTSVKRDPDAMLPFEEIPGAVELFGTPEHLLLALYHRWTLILCGHLRAADLEPEARDVALSSAAPDYTDRVADVWRATAEEFATLRAVLDANLDRYPAALVPALEREQRLVALTAGLAEACEPVHEVTRVGAAFLALTRHRDARPSARMTPVGQLLRLLQSSA